MPYCNEVSVKIESTNRAVFDPPRGKTAAFIVNNLASWWKTIRAAIPRQRNAALDMNATEMRYA